MKNHLKQITSPKTWALPRRGNVFITRPLPSGHPLHGGMPLGVLIRDTLQLAQTMSEVKKILHGKDVLVDGKRRKDPHFLVGLFDTLSFPSLEKHYRMVLDAQGHLALVPIKKEEASLKLGKIVGKSMGRKGQIQYHLHDGRNVASTQPLAVGDSILLSVPGQKIEKALPLKEGAHILIDSGKNAGQMGTLTRLSGKESAYSSPDGDVETVTKYLFVLGEKEPAVTVAEHQKR
ncbi:30S ribosomal protein S4e [Candidatus Woesearchaeota archaeon]|nr:30S ribosomal protein S4e [Candidatus Woesearchaeota archaeon]